MRKRKRPAQRITQPPQKLVPPSRSVREIGGQWFVVEGEEATVAGPFASMAQAWRWSDRNDVDHLAAMDRSARIRTAFSE